MKKEKVDKGFELIYYKLSYRRRFIRTLWLIPWMILVLYCLYCSDIPMFILLPLAVILLLLVLYKHYIIIKNGKKKRK